MSGQIGVLAGVFDPVHNGHLAIASLALDYFKLKKVFFVPSGNPPHKKSSPVSHRIAMLKLALCSEPHTLLYSGELFRPGYSYTFDTITELKQTFNEQICFLIGSDNLTEILHWKNYLQILQMVTLCVAHRPGFPCDIPDIISKKGRVVIYPSPEWGISSTMIRSYIRSGLSCRHLLPESVIKYISMYGLYKD
ncbi:MAG: nicotinate (nicotinamide) nucleotide adenylyltransferase [Fibrobacter sp.]|nr:nicotinate (nicotinamide) nucleotide adenylyltransferase [Fibrobacter sp.]